MNKFNFSTVENFDNHINNSILGYDLLHTLILSLLDFFVSKNSTVVDLGCTTGSFLYKVRSRFNCNCIGYDIDNKQFKYDINLIKQDITSNNFSIPKCNLITSIFTLQFIEYKFRSNIIQKIYNALDDNGIFIFCEKEIINNGFFQDVFTFTNFDYKKNNFTDEEILTKEKQLRAFMRCNSSDENIKLLEQNGFSNHVIFFNSLNFRGYICKK